VLHDGAKSSLTSLITQTSSDSHSKLIRKGGGDTGKKTREGKLTFTGESNSHLEWQRKRETIISETCFNALLCYHRACPPDTGS
jgi:hypothetical protein